MFSHTCRNMKKCPNVLIITLRETTQHSPGKEYRYHVKKIKDIQHIIKDGKLITFKYKTITTTY